MNIHPEILIHWTPREWAHKPLTDDLRKAYVDHLATIYQEGLKFGTGGVYGDLVHSAGSQTPIPQLPILCFTELRLSLVAEHMRNYGQLGIGFCREYLMKRGANPVFYVQNADTGIVNRNIYAIGRVAEISKGVEVFMAYIKPMSRIPGGELDNYDEMEWRIVGCNLGDACPFKKIEDTYFLDFTPSDVKLLVFPDEHTRRLALQHKQLREAFERQLPMMLDSAHVGNI